MIYSIKQRIVIFTVLFAQILSSQSSNTYEDRKDLLFGKMSENTYSNEDSVYFYAVQLKDIARAQNEWGDYIGALFGINSAALYTYNFKVIEKTLKSLDSIFDVQKSYIDNLPDALTHYNYLNYYHGFYYYRLKDYENSLTYFNKMLKRTEHLDSAALTEDNKSEVSIAYSFIGKIYADEGKYDRAKELYEKNIRFLNTHYKGNKDLLYSIYNLLAEVLRKEGAFKTSNDYYLETLEFHQSIESKNSIITSAFNIAENYIDISQADSAKYYLKVAKSYLHENHKYYSRYLQIKANILNSEGEYKQAEEVYHNALAYMKSTLDGKKHSKIAAIHNKMGKFYHENHSYDKALLNYDLALDQFSEDSTNATVVKTERFKILSNKAMTLNMVNNYEASMKNIDEAIHILDEIKPSFRTNKDKLFLSEFSFPLYENALEAAYNLYAQSGDGQYIDKAFYYSEKSKSALLLEALLGVKANKFSKIPNHLLESEKQLKAEIAYLEKKVNDTPSNALFDALYEVNEEYLSLIQSFEDNYTNYFDLKYNLKVVSVRELQNFLSDKDAVFSYFYGNSTLYTIIITKQSKNVVSIKADAQLDELIRSCHELLSDPKSDIKALNSKTNQLYHNTVYPSIERTIEKENLIIISDGLLNYIPFGSLCNNTVSNRYLIEDYSISYANSATLLLQLQEDKTNNKKALAFAPDFKNTPNSILLPLPNNRAEAENVISHFNGDLFIDDNATLQQFHTYNSDYSILHLATHAIYDDTNPEYSYLAFAQNHTNDHLLYASDIYNLSLESDLVTLSACESGIGELKNGIGLMSLARGFYFSGTSSISSTLWKINDASSLGLMNDFYDNLSQGKYKNIALRDAKLRFIEDNKENPLSHPYYWSGYVISGNLEPVPSGNNRWLWVSIGALIILGGGLLLRKKSIG